MTKILLELNKMEFYKQIEKVFAKTEKDINNDVDILQNWCKSQPHLPELPSTSIIRSFLFFNKFSIERTKQKLDMYYTLRTRVPELCTKHPCSSDMIKQSKVTPCVPLPKIGTDNRRILYSSVSDAYGPEDYDFQKQVAVIINIWEILIREDLFLGVHFIFDCGRYTSRHCTKINPMDLRKLSIMLEKSLSNRVASVHCFSCHPTFMKTIELTKSLLPSKLASRFHLHKDCNGILNAFPKLILPNDIGGNEVSISELNELWMQKLQSNKNLFDKLIAMKVNEDLRPTKLDNNEIFGYYGNFKKLDVD